MKGGERMAASSGHPAAGGGSSGALAWVDMACAVNAAWNALTYVHHPELCLDLVSLGLVYDVRGEDGTILVEMTLARPGSAAGERLPQMAQLAVTVGVAGAAPVEVRVVADPPWSPAMIDQAAATHVGWWFH